MKRASIPIAAALAVLFTGCAMPKPQPKPGDLLGHWKTGVVQTEWGPSILEVAFLNEHDLEFKLTPVGGKQSVATKGTYRLSDGRLISEAINKGAPVTIWLDRDQLILQAPSQPPQRFNRL